MVPSTDACRPPADRGYPPSSDSGSPQTLGGPLVRRSCRWPRIPQDGSAEGCSRGPQQGMKVANHLSAQVALGRCRFDLGDFAGAIADFERVVRQDPTQLVANKLLAEAHLGAGNLDQAAHRLDVYTLLNNRDPEIEPLRERITAGARASAEPTAPAESIPSPSPAPVAAAAEGSSPARTGDVFNLPPLRLPAPDLAEAVPERRWRAPASGTGTLFSGLGTASDRRRYVNPSSSVGPSAWRRRRAKHLLRWSSPGCPRRLPRCLPRSHPKPK